MKYKRMVYFPMKNNHGFTMLEMVTVIAIIAIVTAVAIPNYLSWLSNTRLKAAVGDLSADLNFARLRAIRENAQVAVVISVANNSYQIFVDNGAGGGTASNGVQDGGEVLLRSVVMPSGISIQDVSFTSDRCSFNGSGIPIGLSSVPNTPDVYMKNKNNKLQGIVVSLVGTVRVMTKSSSEGNWEYWEPH